MPYGWKLLFCAALALVGSSAIIGCDSSSAPTAPSQGELGDYLQSHPEEAMEEAPEIESE